MSKTQLNARSQNEFNLSIDLNPNFVFRLSLGLKLKYNARSNPKDKSIHCMETCYKTHFEKFCRELPSPDHWPCPPTSEDVMRLLVLYKLFWIVQHSTHSLSITDQYAVISVDIWRHIPKTSLQRVFRLIQPSLLILLHYSVYMWRQKSKPKFFAITLKLFTNFYQI